MVHNHQHGILSLAILAVHRIHVKAGTVRACAVRGAIGAVDEPRIPLQPDLYGTLSIALRARATDTH